MVLYSYTSTWNHIFNGIIKLSNFGKHNNMFRDNSLSMTVIGPCRIRVPWTFLKRFRTPGFWYNGIQDRWGQDRFQGIPDFIKVYGSFFDIYQKYITSEVVVKIMVTSLERDMITCFEIFPMLQICYPALLLQLFVLLF